MPGAYIRFSIQSKELSQRFQSIMRHLPNVIDESLHQINSEAQGMFAKTTETWTHQPSFVAGREQTSNSIGWSVSTDSQIYKWTNYGTQPHIIEARRVALLRFTVPFTAKTKPRVISSFRGSRGNQWVSKRKVNHPGTEAREFSKTIRERLQPIAEKRLLNVIKAWPG